MLNFIASIPKVVERFLDKFSSIFKYDQHSKFKQYISAIFLEMKRFSMQAVNERTLDSNYESIQHFIKDSPWSEQAINSQRINIMEKNRQTKSCSKGALVIDDTSAKKSGNHTEGAQVQHCGGEPHLTNCNTVVISHYVDDVKDFPVNLEPYKPSKEFPCGKESEEFFGKPELAKRLVRDALVKGIRFSDVIIDSWYTSKDFIEFVENLSLSWIGELKSNRLVYYQGEEISLKKLVTLLSPDDFSKIETTTRKGRKSTRYICPLLLKIKDIPSKKWIIIEKENLLSTDCSKIRFIATNKIEASAQDIVNRFKIRWGIEDLHRDLKDNLYLDHYQVRDIRSIKRHWLLCFVAYTFLVFSKMKGSFAKLIKQPAQTIGELLKIVRELNFVSFCKWFKVPKNINVFLQYLRLKKPNFA